MDTASVSLSPGNSLLSESLSNSPSLKNAIETQLQEEELNDLLTVISSIENSINDLIEHPVCQYVNFQPKTDPVNYLARYPQGGPKAILEFYQNLAEEVSEQADNAFSTVTATIEPALAQLIETMNFKGARAYIVANFNIDDHPPLFELIDFVQQHNQEETSSMSDVLLLHFMGLTILRKKTLKQFCLNEFLPKEVKELLSQAVQQYESSNSFRERGAKGREALELKRRQVRALAIKLAQEKNYQTARNAAKLIVEEVLEFSKKIGADYSQDSFQMADNIARWLREAKIY